MSTLRFESHLNWPDWLPVTSRVNQRGDHGLTADITLTDSIGYLQQELQDMPASGVLSLDMDQPLVERLRRKTGSRSGVALTLRYNERSYTLACDKWLTLEHNIYALHIALRQWRSIERWGVAPMGVLLYGFQGSGLNTADMQTAASVSESNHHWMAALGLGPTATLEDAIAVYHRRAKQAAQDSDTLAKLNIVIEDARNYFASKAS